MALARSPFVIAAALLCLAAPAASWAQDAVQAAPAAKPSATATSPDGRIAVTVSLSGENHLQYEVLKDGKPLIAPSKIRFSFTDQDPMSRGFTIDGQQTSKVDTRWEQPWGERKTVVDRHTELVVRAHDRGASDAMTDNATDRPLTLRFRIFDDGVGFRAEFSDRGDGKAWNIADEDTEFVVAQPGTAWWIQGGDWNRYEQLYKQTAIDAVGTAHTPMTVKLADGTHLSFHEAALVDYSAMWLKRVEGQRFKATLAPSSRGSRVTRTGAFATPWRSIRIAKDAPGLYDNDLELNLNEPNKLGDVSWVKPFRYVGVWWSLHLETESWASGPKHGATTANTKRYIDFAAKHGFRGVLVEGWNRGWEGNWFANGRSFSFTEAYPDFDIEELARYGRRKGVRLIGHHETGANIAVYEAQLEDALALYQRLGIDSVKTGYVADAGGIIAPGDTPGSERMEWHDGQRSVQHHLKVVEAAARHRIAVNPHEPIKDTGLRRTYPNWVAREGARGGEYQAWGDPGNPPDHIPNLIFTRMLSGPMDYTPGVLSLKGRGGRDLQTTLAKELALYVVLYSPIQMAADLPENLEKHPRELDFISKVPTDWAETRTLAGEVGDYAVMARKDRNGPNWYLGAVTDEQPRTQSVTLDFLEPGRAYTAVIYRDGAGADYRTARRHSIAYEKRRVKKGDTLEVAMAPGGGYVARLEARR
jgi:alpha-glucosidase